MKKTCLHFLMAAAVTAGVSSAWAADGAKRPEGGRPGAGQFFERLDTDGDGKITQAEAPAQAWERLGKADTNNDGAVSKEELAAAFKARMESGGGAPGAGGAGMAAMIMQRMDTDGDGKITEAEAGERWARLGQLDKNGDGAVTQDELPARGPGGPGKPGVPGAGAGAGAGNRGEFFAKADANGDEKLTQDEVPAQAWERLSKLDSNLDGAISKEELAAVKDRVAGEKKKLGNNPDAGNGTQPKRPPVEES